MVSLSKVLNINGIVFYTLLNFIDKGVNFCIPIMILYLFDKEVYSEIEYIISTSLFISCFLDFGIRSYAFYDYKLRKDLAIEEVKNALDTILIPQLLIYTIALILYPNIITIAISLRAFFFSFQYIFTTYNRLVDTPYKSFMYSIPINLLLLLVALSVFIADKSYNINWYIICYVAFAVFYLIKYLSSTDRQKKIVSTFNYMLESILFSWPIMLCLIGSTLVQNIIKIYGYNKISIDEYSEYALTLRLFMLAVLLYQSINGYFQKEIYICKRFPFKVFFLYVACALIGFVIALIIWLVLPSISNFHFLPLIGFILLCSYYLLLCIRSFLEAFLMKYNQVKKIALFSVISILIFFSALFVFDEINVIKILIWQLIAETINMILVVLSVYKNIINDISY